MLELLIYMAVFDYLIGYQCKFIDSVHDNLYCKKCTLVARRLTFTSCCGESYCHACIAAIQQQDKPCPECGHQNFSTMKPLKYQRQIDCLKVYCSMREKGCGWSGTLGQLDAHLDPDQNHCQHVDIKCPLNCQQTIPKKKLEQHVAMECVKRDSVCRYCHFKATYEVMVDTHWPACIYLPLQCPNFCGVTCERDVMEDHMRMCCLEEVACEFNDVGCDGRFRREDQEEHARKNNQKHLTMTAAASVKMSQQQELLQQKEWLQEQEEKLQEQGEKQQEQVEKLQEQEEQLQEQEDRLQEQEEQLQEQEEQLQEQENRLQEQEMLQEQEPNLKNKFEEQKLRLQEEKKKTEKELQQQEQKFEKKFKQQEQKFHNLLLEHEKKFVELQEKADQNEVAVREVKNSITLKRTFAMEYFSREKEKDMPGVWKSSAMYTHVRGYKFCVGIDANGHDYARGKAMEVHLWAMQGEYDHQLKWPAQASFTIELLHQYGGENIIHTSPKELWYKPKEPYVWICTFTRKWYGMYCAFLEYSKLTDFLANDTLYFCFSKVTCDVHTTTLNY